MSLQFIENSLWWAGQLLKVLADTGGGASVLMEKNF